MKDLAWELQCYGCSEETLRNSIEASCYHKRGNYADLVASMLSDAQEELSMIDFETNGAERARQTLNRAKFVLFNYVEKEEA